MSEQRVPVDNPAGRLYEILAAAMSAEIYKEVNSEVMVNVRQAERQAREVLAEVLHVDPNDAASLFRELTKLFNLINLARESVMYLRGVRHELYLKPLEDIEQAFGKFDYTKSWSSFKQSFDSNTLARLEFCADTLSSQLKEKIVDSDYLATFQAEIEMLLEEVIGSNLSEEMKSFLFEKLQDINQAIRNYRFYGSKSLEYALESTLGGLILRKDKLPEKGKSKVLDKFFDVVAKLNALLNVGTKLQEVLPPIVERFIGTKN
jgi:hypothetical protein